MFEASFTSCRSFGHSLRLPRSIDQSGHVYGRSHDGVCPELQISIDRMDWKSLGRCLIQSIISAWSGILEGIGMFLARVCLRSEMTAARRCLFWR